jgi:Txe/YoeB family toxin of toxin-antitoxin system
VTWKLVYTKAAKKDAKKLAGTQLDAKARELLRLLAEDPYRSPPRFDRHVGDLSGACSRRINIQHRLVYQVLDDRRSVKVLRMWTHSE